MSNNKGIDWDEQPLGKVTDSMLAKMNNVASTVVRRARARRGIPAFWYGIDWDNQPLGKEFDSVLAKKLRCERTTVRDQRRKREIPAHSQEKICPVCLKSFSAVRVLHIFCCERCRRKTRVYWQKSQDVEKNLRIATAVISRTIAEAEGRS